MAEGSQFDCLNSEEVIATSIRGLKQFITERGDKVNSIKLDAPKVNKEDAATDAEKAFLLNTGHQKGYLDALRDIQTYIKNVGM